MSRRVHKEPESPGPAEPSNAAPALVAVPRAWLTLLTVLGIAPWVALGVTLFRPTGGPRPPDAALSSAAPAQAAGGPWGDLDITPITISPPIEYVPKNWGAIQASAWTFPDATAGDAERFLVSAGLPAADAARLRAGARSTPVVNGVSLLPDAGLVRSLSPDVRARIYLKLGELGVGVDRTRAPINFDQVTAYRYYGDSIDDWLGTSTLQPATRALVDPFIYRHDHFLYFADIEQVRPAIQDPAELQRLAKRLMRHETVLVRVRVGDPTHVDAITEYWGRGGRRTDIRPIIESIARTSVAIDDPSTSIDVSHLLPQLARQLLYRYPKVSAADMDRPLLANCLWTALNFFSAEPDPRYLDVPYALAHLRSDYFVVEDGYQLGDIVTFSDRDGTLIHAAVYLADDLVFSKNGTTPLAPWSILPLDHLKGHYAEYAGTWRITYFRRKDL